MKSVSSHLISCAFRDNTLVRIFNKSVHDSFEYSLSTIAGPFFWSDSPKSGGVSSLGYSETTVNLCSAFPYQSVPHLSLRLRSFPNCYWSKYKALRSHLVCRDVCKAYACVTSRHWTVLNQCRMFVKAINLRSFRFSFPDLTHCPYPRPRLLTSHEVLLIPSSLRFSAVICWVPGPSIPSHCKWRYMLSIKQWDSLVVLSAISHSTYMSAP